MAWHLIEQKDCAAAGLTQEIYFCDTVDDFNDPPESAPVSSMAYAPYHGQLAIVAKTEENEWVQIAGEALPQYEVVWYEDLTLNYDGDDYGCYVYESTCVDGATSGAYIPVPREDTILVDYNGTSYVLESINDYDDLLYGNASIINNSYDDTGEPFCIRSRGYVNINNWETKVFVKGENPPSTIDIFMAVCVLMQED